MYWQVAAIITVGAAARLYHLNAQSLWHDEAISVIVSRAPLSRMLDYFQASAGRLPFEYNPPVYAFVLHGWFAIFGVGDYQARLLSVTAGIVALLLIFSLARSLFGTATGLCAALLLALSQLGVMFSQEARNYELFLVLFLTTARLFWMAVSRRHLLAWCLCTLSAALMVLTNYYGAFAILALGLYLLFERRSVPLQWVVGGAAAGAVALLPWMRFALRAQLSAASDRVQPSYFTVGASTVVGTLTRFSNGALAGLLESTPAWAVAISAILFLGPIVALLVTWTREKRAADHPRPAILFAFVLWAVPLASVLVLSFVWNVQYNVRYVAFCIAPFYILVAAGLTRLPGSRLRQISIVTVACYSAYALTANYRVSYKENYRDAVSFITAQATPEDCYAFVPFGTPPLEWSIYSKWQPRRLLKPESGSTSECRKVWVVTYDRLVTNAHARWREWLVTATSGFTKSADRQFFWVRVEEYNHLAVR